MSLAKNSACKYRVAHSDVYGRYLVAAKNIEAGEIILRETPLVVGPLTLDNLDLCFACMRTIFGKPSCLCTNCDVAYMCSRTCQKSQGHHSQEECDLLRTLKGDASVVSGVLLQLRLWLLRKKTTLWDEMVMMESHVEERKNTQTWSLVQDRIVVNFCKWNLIDGTEKSSDLVQRICGILDVNTFELRSPNNLGATSAESCLRGLYLKAALMAHSCAGNTLLTVDNDFTLTTYASRRIREDEPIFFNYTSPLLSYAERRAHLMHGKYFLCRCEICLDPTEGGCYLSAISCPKCKTGHVLMKDPSAESTLPYSRNAKWQCESCAKVLRGCLVKVTLNIARNLIDEVPDDARKMESLLKKLSRSLHANHFLMLILKQKLLSAYRSQTETEYVEKKSLERMLELFEQVLRVVEVMEPGLSRLGGILLYEMHVPLVMLANRAHTRREISSQELIDKLEEGRALVKQALNVLLLEPIISSEGFLAKEALQAFKELGRSVVDAKLLPR